MMSLFLLSETNFFNSFPIVLVREVAGSERIGRNRMVRINGEELDIAGKTVAEYVAQAGYDPQRIAVECNGDIVFKALYASTVLKDGDVLEVVSFVGGG